MAAGAGIGFKLAAGALLWALSGKSGKKTPKGGSLNKQGEAQVGLNVASHLTVPNSINTADAFTTNLLSKYKDPAVDIVTAVGFVGSAIASPVMAAVLVLVVEVAYSIFLGFSYFKSLDDALKKGVTGADKDLKTIATECATSAAQVLVQAGFDADVAAGVGELYGFYVARAYNNAATAYFIWLVMQVSKRDPACPGYSPGAANQNVISYWSDRGVVVDPTVNDAYLASQGDDVLWQLFFGARDPIAAEIQAAVLTRAGVKTATPVVPPGAYKPLETWASANIGDWGVLRAQAEFIGRAAWASMAMTGRWDCAGPFHFGPWISPGAGAEKFFTDLYAKSGSIVGLYDATAKHLTDQATGVVWDVGKTFATNKMSLILPD